MPSIASMMPWYITRNCNEGGRKERRERAQKTSVFLVSQINSKYFSFSRKKTLIFYMKKKNTQFYLLAETRNGVSR